MLTSGSSKYKFALVFVFLTIIIGTKSLSADPTGNVIYLFSDTFTDGNFSEWTIVDAINAESSPSNWSVVQAKGSQVLLQDSNINTPANYEGTYAYTGDANWSDYHVNVDVNPDDNDSVFVIFRYVDDDNYYRFIMNEQEGFRRVERKQAGVYSTLAEDTSLGYGVDDGWLNIQISLVGSTIEIFYEYEQIFAISDSTFPNGKVGLGTSASINCYFDNFIVTPSGIDTYADLVIDSTILQSGNQHSEPTDILGPTRYKDSEYEFDFLSMGGPGNYIVLDMGENEEIVDGDGNDLRIYEIGAALGGVNEEHDVYVSNSPTGPWQYVGQGAAVSEFDLNGSGLSTARYVRIEDLSTKTDGTSVPGSDIDAVQALNMEPPQCLLPPIDVLYEVVGSNVHLSWSEVEEAIGYNVYIGTTTANSLLNETPITATEFIHNNGSASLDDGYYYTVTAIGATGCESSFSQQVPYRLFLPYLVK